MATQKSSDLVVAIHPIALISISDYHTRSQANAAKSEIAGALLGLQTGREVSIEIVFELVLDTQAGTIDQDFLTTRLDQYKQTFPNLDLIGWFTTAPASPATLQLHNLFTALNPLPILLVLDPSGLSASHDVLPIKVYESIPAAGGVDLGEVEFRLETGEAERIGVEHVSKAQKKVDGERTDADELVSVLQTQASAIRMLQARIETIKEYLVEVQEGKTPADERMIREISSLLYRLPAASSPEFAEEFEGSWGGVLLASLFTEILKGTGDIHEVSQKVGLMTESRRKRLGMAGRLRGRPGPFGEPMGFDTFFTSSWTGKEI